MEAADTTARAAEAVMEGQEEEEEVAERTYRGEPFLYS